ncbi:MAG: RNA polymerase factor sigma-54 [Gammaproteobacteria bacterium]|jgi:RNA polymerase sigma-54 factor|nr:RNA polymerase factor sigma-54 [Gammaproteobacteria bacterium]
MKPSIQLRLSQHLTMTPQLQQAIRLLQLSTLDLKQEIQEALETNPLLETVEEGEIREQAREHQATAAEPSEAAHEPEDYSSDDQDYGGGDAETTVSPTDLPQELPVDSAWEDIYEPAAPPSSGSGSDGESPDVLAQKAAGQTLFDHLMWQLNLTPFNDTDLAIATAIVDAISEDGYLTQTLEDICLAVDDPDVGPAEVEAVLHRIQNFDPPGVGARSPQECLLIQLRQLPPETPCRDTALRLVGDHFGLLAGQDQGQIRRRLKLEEDELRGVTQLIRSLNPRPGSQVADAETQYVEPDVFVHKKDGVWRVELNPEATPRLRVNADYAALIRRADNSLDNQFLKNHLQEARWFIKSLRSRNETLLRVATKIVEFQRGFLEHGAEAMRPLVLRDVADALEMHESTVSRVTTQKYMYTPRGTLEFKYFFSSHVSTSTGGEASATAIRALIKKLIAAERADKPLSDSKIAEILVDQGIEVARRTVAKYRESMAIPPSNERKRLV